MNDTYTNNTYQILPILLKQMHDVRLSISFMFLHSLMSVLSMYVRVFFVYVEEPCTATIILCAKHAAFIYCMRAPLALSCITTTGTCYTPVQRSALHTCFPETRATPLKRRRLSCTPPESHRGRMSLVLPRGSPASCKFCPTSATARVRKKARHPPASRSERLLYFSFLSFPSLLVPSPRSSAVACVCSASSFFSVFLFLPPGASLSHCTK